MMMGDLHPALRDAAQEALACPKTGKTRHATRREADDWLRHLQRKHSANGLNVYRCRWCGAFHLGHLGPEERIGPRKKHRNAW